MAIDFISLSLSRPADPVYKNNVVNLVATATTKLAGSNTDATRVEFELLKGVVGGLGGPGNQGPGLLIPASNQKVSSSTSTGVYNATFAAALFADPGIYQIRAKAIVGGGSPEVISTFLVAESATFTVLDLNQADLFNLLTDSEKEDLDSNHIVKWESVSLTGADVKAATGVNSSASKTVKIASIPTGATLVGGLVNVTVADAGAASTSTATLGANSTAFNEVLGATDLRTVAETGVSASFVPNLAGGVDLKTVIAVTGSSKTIADLDDTTAFTFKYGYVVPAAHSLGV